MSVCDRDHPEWPPTINLKALRRTKALANFQEYLDAAWAADLRNSCGELPDLDGSSDESSCAFIVAGDLEECAAEESAGEFADVRLQTSLGDAIRSLTEV
jgi:hypothetical protein